MSKSPDRSDLDNAKRRLVPILLVATLGGALACFGRSDIAGLGLGESAAGQSCQRDADCQLGLVCAIGVCEQLGGGTDVSNPTPDAGDVTLAPEDCTGFKGYLTLGDEVDGDTLEATNDHAGSCGGGSSPEDVWVLQLTEAEDIVISTFGSDFDTVIYVRRVCDDPAELVCVDEQGGESVVLTGAEPGDYYVFVDGFGEAGEYSLFVNID